VLELRLRHGDGLHTGHSLYALNEPVVWERTRSIRIAGSARGGYGVLQDSAASRMEIGSLSAAAPLRGVGPVGAG
jgi:hypothetical protein